jgi:lipopolysaccharide export system permease protein
LKKLDVFVIKSYIGPLVLTFFISLFILVMQFLWKYVDDLVGKGLEWYIIGELLFYASSTFVPLALPLAILLSSLMTFGNLGEQYELVALKASGISLRRIMKPLVALSLVISIMAFLFSNYVLPIANLKFHSLLYDVRQQKLTLNIKEGIFYNGIEGFTIRVASKDQEKNILKDIMIYNHSQRLGNTQLTVAKWGTMEMAPDKSTLIFKLFDGFNYEEITDRRNYKITRPFQRSQFKEQTRRFGGLDFALNRTNEELFRNNYQMMNLGQLSQTKDSLSEELVIRKNTFRKSIREKYEFLYAKVDTLKKAPNISASQAAKDTSSLIPTDSIIRHSTDSISLIANDSTSQLSTNSVTRAENDSIIQLSADSVLLASNDSILPASASSVTSNTSNLLGGLTKTEKAKILDFALQSARSVKNNIEYSKKDFEERQLRVRKHEIEWHRKFTLSIACLILFFIGAPLGAIIRKGGLGLPVVVSVFFFVIFHIISITGEKYARAGILEPHIAMWLASAVLLPLGIFLTYKATTDSPILEADAWNRILKKILFFKKSEAQTNPEVK